MLNCRKSFFENVLCCFLLVVPQSTTSESDHIHSDHRTSKERPEIIQNEIQKGIQKQNIDFTQ